MKILKQVIVLAIIIAIFYACNSNSNSSSTPMADSVAVPVTPKTAEELKQELKEKEQLVPTEYLSARSSMKENVTQEPDLFHHKKTDGYILSGSIKNSASIAKFKDAVIIVTFLSETDSEMESKEFIVYKFFNPNSSTEFDEKVYPPPGFKNFTAQIKTATPVN